MLNLNTFVIYKISESLISKLLLEMKINVSLIPIAYGVIVKTNERSVDIVTIRENNIEFSKFIISVLIRKIKNNIINWYIKSLANLKK